MEGLLQSVPVSLADEIALLIVLVAVTLFVVTSFSDLGEARRQCQSSSQQLLKRLRLRRGGRDLQLAFSRGILQPKIYA